MDSQQEPSGAAASYDDIPYDSEPLVETHPDSLATAATLLGIEPPPIDRCRVLELGCGVGINLVAMADALPESQFLGIDFSPRQVAAGQAVIDAAGLTNVRLEAMDLLQFDETFGQFDYIICHGVYSWAPAEVRDKILEICSGGLGPRGVAYVSYNTYPGWHARTMVREMLCFHARRFADPPTRIREVRALIEFLARAAPQPGSAYSRAIAEIAEFLGGHHDSYVFHEFLEDVNHPVYFHQFAEHLAARKLKFLGEPWLSCGLHGFSGPVQEDLRRLAPDALLVEQYGDFLTGRTFRRSMLAHAELPTLELPSAARVAGLYVATLVAPVSQRPDVTSQASEAFRGKDNLTVTTSVPPLKAALVALAMAWPAAISFDALCGAVGKLLVGSFSLQDQAARDLLAQHLLRAYQSLVVSLHVRPYPLVTAVSPRPMTTRLIRYQASANLRLTNLRHYTVDVGDFERLVLTFLDGQRDHATIVDAVLQAIDEGKATIEPPLQTADAGEPRTLVSERLRPALASLARASLLVQ